MIMYLLFFLSLSSDVKRELDDLSKTIKNFEARVGLVKDLETMSSVRSIASSCFTDEVLRKTMYIR